MDSNIQILGHFFIFWLVDFSDVFEDCFSKSFAKYSFFISTHTQGQEQGGFWDYETPIDSYDVLLIL